LDHDILIHQGRKIHTRIFTAAIVLGTLLPAFPQAIPQTGDWPAFGRDPGGTRYSPLDQINTKNVSTLQRAWTYHTRESGRSFESTPIFVDNVLYLTTHTQKVIALDPETGQEIWRYDAKRTGQHFSPRERYITGLRNGEGIAVDAAGQH